MEPHHRWVPTSFGVLLIALVVVAFTWSTSGSAEIYETAPHAPAVATGQLPAAVPAVPAFSLRRLEPFTRSQIARLERAPGVAAVAAVKIEPVRIFDAQGTARVMKLAVVEPLRFRNVAASPMNDADFVWTSLIEGEAVVTNESAKILDLGNDPTIRFVGGTEIAVGALADIGTPSLADVVISRERWEGDPQDAMHLTVKAGDKRTRSLSGSVTSKDPPRAGRDKVEHVAVVGAESGVAISALRDILERRAPDTRLERLLPKVPVVPPRIQKVPSAPDLSVVVPAPVVAGLHPVLAESVDRLVSASANRVWVISGYRTTEHQYGLWVSALQRYGSPEAARHWVAPPGHSAHERGLAVDLGGDLGLAARLIEELRLPLWRPMTWEPWHFELVGSRG